MKIPNYDLNTKNSSSKRLNDIFDEDFRLLIAGQTRCGKTNTLMHILRKPLVYYEKIYIYSPDHHQDKIQDFKELMDSVQSWKLANSRISPTQMNIHLAIEKLLFLIIL